MAEAVRENPGLLPARKSGRIRAFVLAVLVHGLLFALLYLGIRWQSRPPAAVEAELWSEPPRAAAPAPAPKVEPPPEPPKPVVREEPKAEPPPPKPVIEVKEEKKKPEPKKAEPAKVPPKDPPRVSDEIKRMAELEEEKLRLKRDIEREQLAQKAAGEASARAQAAAQGAAAEWNDRVSAKVRSRIPASVADVVPGNPEALFEVTVLPSMEVGNVKMVKSSGNAAYDEAAERAIRAASPLPPGNERFTPPRLVNLRMRPKDK